MKPAPQATAERKDLNPIAQQDLLTNAPRNLVGVDREVLERTQHRGHANARAADQQGEHGGRHRADVLDPHRATSGHRVDSATCTYTVDFGNSRTGPANLRNGRLCGEPHLIDRVDGRQIVDGRVGLNRIG